MLIPGSTSTTTFARTVSAVHGTQSLTSPKQRCCNLERLDVTRVGGRDHSFGTDGNSEREEKYRRLPFEHAVERTTTRVASAEVTVSERDSGLTLAG